jgi:hypothetical protein
MKFKLQNYVQNNPVKQEIKDQANKYYKQSNKKTVSSIILPKLTFR